MEIIKQSGAPAPTMQNEAPLAEQPGLTRGNDKMSNEQYDQHGTDQESKRQWEASSDIRVEFNNDFESFKEFRRAESQGLIKIQGGQHV